MSGADWQTQQFERHRIHLLAVAYRMLGSLSDAEDAGQEAWLRLNRSTDSPIADMGAWLTTVDGAASDGSGDLNALDRYVAYRGSDLLAGVASASENNDPAFGSRSWGLKSAGSLPPAVTRRRWSGSGSFTVRPRQITLTGHRTYR